MGRGDSQRSERRGWGLTKRFLLGVCVVFLGLACAGAMWNLLAVRRDRAANPPPGKIYDVAGYPMHLYCTGSGSPTVVLESGHGEDFTVWGKVQPTLSQITRTCSYDRAGFGWSAAQPGDRDALHIAQQLNGLLKAAGIAEPIVLVAHSAGGLYARVYASQFPGALAGLVLVDAHSPTPLPKPAVLEAMDHHSRLEFAVVKTSVALGIARAVGQCDMVAEGLEMYAAWIKATTCYYPSADAYVREDDALEQSRAEAANAAILGSLPVLVLSQDPSRPVPSFLQKRISQADWVASCVAHDKEQEAYLKLSTRARRVVASGSSHYIQYDRPDMVVKETGALVLERRAAMDFQPLSEPGGGN